MKERIKKCGLSITWVANKLGIPRPTLNSYLNGFRTMNDDVNKKLNELLKHYEQRKINKTY